MGLHRRVDGVRYCGPRARFHGNSIPEAVDLLQQDDGRPQS